MATAKGYFYTALGHLSHMAEVDPRAVPEQCTLIPPPKCPAGFVPCFFDGHWDMESEVLAAMAINDDLATIRNNHPRD